jgi:hypothetical protein
MLQPPESPAEVRARHDWRSGSSKDDISGIRAELTTTPGLKNPYHIQRKRFFVDSVAARLARTDLVDE